MLQSRQINPWSWQEGVLATPRPGGSTVPMPSSSWHGQGPISAEGELVGEGDFAAQARQTFENIGRCSSRPEQRWTRSSS